MSRMKFRLRRFPAAQFPFLEKGMRHDANTCLSRSIVLRNTTPEPLGAVHNVALIDPA
jgi:hypothetical protein